MNSYLNDRLAIDRLKKEYQEHKNLIIGFDFDSTIYDYHKENLNLQPVIDLLKKCSDLGFVMCLHTLCLNYAEMNHFDKSIYAQKLGINVHFINFSPILNQQKEGFYPKPFYSILLDDRAGLSASYNILLTTLKELNLWD